jgi:hypothetical protein
VDIALLSLRRAPNFLIVEILVSEHVIKAAFCLLQITIVQHDLNVTGQNDGFVEDPFGCTCPLIDSGNHDLAGSGLRSQLNGIVNGFAIGLSHALRTVRRIILFHHCFSTFLYQQKWKCQNADTSIISDGISLSTKQPPKVFRFLNSSIAFINGVRYNYYDYIVKGRNSYDYYV